jgi:hypothetical protein
LMQSPSFLKSDALLSSVRSLTRSEAYIRQNVQFMY